MSRRIPLGLTLVPLIAALGIYWLFWSGWADDFKAALQPWLPGTELVVTGFPYRLETEVARPGIAAGDIVKLIASATTARINRGPWQPALTVVNTQGLRFSAIVSEGLSATLAGKTAATSIKVDAGRLQRLSTRIEAASLGLGMTAMPITADSLELHLRELIPTGTIATAPTGAPRGQLVIAGERLRLGGGDALTLAADITVTGAGRLLGYDAWAPTGTLELTRLRLADAHGEIAGVRATLVPSGRRGLRFAGAIETICPLTVVAALDGRVAAPEKRLRVAVRLSFEGAGNAVSVQGLPLDLATRPVRGQLPACPMVRGQL